MAKEREPRLLSIGSAVRFTHNGVTIHGHLLQRQGRRRFAKVIDNEERTWRVPESALKDTGGGRRTTMVTPHDEARAYYRLGDRVAFLGLDGPMRGEIVKLNPKRARVRCGEACWNVPYGLLGVAEGQAARNGPERLNCIAGMARRLMDEHGLTGWTLALSNPGAASATAISVTARFGSAAAIPWRATRRRSGTPFCTKLHTRSRGPTQAMGRCGRRRRSESEPRRGRRCTMTNRAEPGIISIPATIMSVAHARRRSAGFTASGSVRISSRLPKRVL